MKVIVGFHSEVSYETISHIQSHLSKEKQYFVEIQNFMDRVFPTPLVFKFFKKNITNEFFLRQLYKELEELCFEGYEEILFIYNIPPEIVSLFNYKYFPIVAHHGDSNDIEIAFHKDQPLEFARKFEFLLGITNK